jgi:hypothetical protein
MASASIYFGEWASRLCSMEREKPLCSISSLTGTTKAAVGPQRYVKRELTSVSIDFEERPSRVCTKEGEEGLFARYDL